MHLFCCLDRCKRSKARNDFYSTMSNTSSMHNARLPSTISSFHTANLSVLEFTMNNKFNDGQYANDGKDHFDPVVDNQPLCQIHQTLHKSTLPGYQSPYTEELSRVRHNTHNPTSEYNASNNYLKSMDGSQKEGDILSDLTTPQRPVLGQFGNWHSNNSSPTHKLLETANSNPHLVNSHSQGNIYAEVDPEYEVDSGFTEESSDLASERKEDSLYNSSSSNSNLGYYQEYRTRNGFPRPDLIGSVKPSIQENHNRFQTNKPAVRGKPKIFSISKTLYHGNIPYSSDDSEDKPVSGLSLQKARDRNMRKTKTEPPQLDDDKLLLSKQERRYQLQQGGDRFHASRHADGDRQIVSPKHCQIHNYYSSCERL